jgi:uncharacterized protein
VRVAVRVKAGARRTVVGGRWDGPGGPALVVAVTAPAVEGKANAAVVEALAEAFGVRRSRVRIVAGARGRDKVVEIDGAAGLDARLSALLRSEPR